MLFAVVAVCILTVPLAGGRLLAFANLRFRHPEILFSAFALQFAIFKLWPLEPEWFHSPLYLFSYGLGGWFLVLNRKVPGLWLIGVGALCNGLAIAANGGVMPGSVDAFNAARLVASPEHFVNSRAVADPRLLFLGDVFAVPSWLPFHNVFSLGDLCIVLGALVGLHRISGSRLLPSGSGQFTELLQEREFMRLWLAQAVSNQGDWVYSLGVVASLARQDAGPGTLALLVVMQAAPRAFAGAFGGPLVDRLSRKRLMVIADLVRAAAVGSLLLYGTPSLAHIYLVAATLGLFAAVFQPSLQASIPNVVPEHRLVAANALVSVTFQLAVMVGPVVGALLVAHMGLGPAFAVNAGSFVLSAVLVGGMRLPHRRDERAAAVSSPWQDLR
ncbi:MAG TPA: MFS transporter, partial [Acidimicrobiales bacterium]